MKTLIKFIRGEEVLTSLSKVLERSVDLSPQTTRRSRNSGPRLQKLNLFDGAEDVHMMGPLRNLDKEGRDVWAWQVDQNLWFSGGGSDAQRTLLEAACSKFQPADTT